MQSLLTVIAGKKDENLSSSVLKFVLDRSPEIRRGAMRALWNACPPAVASLSAKASFGVSLEVGTGTTMGTGDDPERGFIDLILELDDAVIGVENKLKAVVQGNQPSKYLADLQARAAALGRARSRKVHCACIVLAPGYRRKEIMETVQVQAGFDGTLVGFCAWETLLEQMSREVSTDPVARFLLLELEAFVLDRIGSLRELPDIIPRLRIDLRDLDDLGTHAMVIERLWAIVRPLGLGASATRLAADGAKRWLGYAPLREKQPSSGLSGLDAWFGFVSSRLITPRREGWGTELVLSISREIPGMIQPGSVDKVDISEGFQGQPHRYRFCFDATWTNPEAWHAALAPCHEFVAALRR